MKSQTKRKEGDSEYAVGSKRSRKKRVQISADLEEERRLTALLFGASGAGTKKPPVVAAASSHRDAFGADIAGRHRRTQGIRAKDDRVAAEDQSQPLFEIDRAGTSDAVQDGNDRRRKRDEAVSEEEDDDDHSRESKNETKGMSRRQPAAADAVSPAWEDDDDDALRLNLMESSYRLRKLRTSRNEAVGSLPGRDLEARLRSRFRSTAELTARTDWARVDDRGNALQSVGDPRDVQESTAHSLFGGPGLHRKLPAGVINMVRCRDANQSDPSRSVVQAVHFHPASDPTNPLLLTAGLDKTLRFFQAGDEKSTKVHGIHFPKLPIYSASFLGSTGNVIVSGRRPFFYVYDAASGGLDYIPRVHAGRQEKSLERFATSPDGRTVAFMGNDGYVILFDAARKQWMTDLKMNGSVRAITFTPSGDQIVTSGSDGDVYRWDLRNACRCVERYPNEDGTITSYLAASSRHLAVGAESGVVNLYSELETQPAASKRTPIKSILNLHTSADMLRFNSDGQILSVSSRREQNGLKLVHVPTATVFANWPTSKTPLSYVWSHDFSPGSRYFAVGNDKGNCLLYRVSYYDENS